MSHAFRQKNGTFYYFSYNKNWEVKLFSNVLWLYMYLTYDDKHAACINLYTSHTWGHLLPILIHMQNLIIY